MLAAGLVARNAAAKGLKAKPWVKTSLAPGSRVVSEYLEKAELIDDLEKVGFYTVGYGCTTCIGNSGPLKPEIADAVTSGDVVGTSVLSGNRNFEGRIHALVQHNFLASPPLVVAYALAGNMDVDLFNDPLGQDQDGNDVYMKDIWPSQQEVQDAVANNIDSEMFNSSYGKVFEGDANWKRVESPTGDIYTWEADSTYVKNPPYFDGMSKDATPVSDIKGARVLALLGDSVTTDHISPAGAIAKDSPAAAYLEANGVKPSDFNSYGSRRGNHEVMMRGTFANIRLRNQLAPGTEGGWTCHQPSGEQMSIFDGSVKYREEGTPLVVLAGSEYGTGSSRDWAAKGTVLLGVRAVIAKELRAYSPFQPDRHGRFASAVPRRPGCRIAGTHRYRDLRHYGPDGPECQDSQSNRDVCRRAHDDLRGAGAHRYAEGTRLLRERRHPALRSATARRVAMAANCDIPDALIAALRDARHVCILTGAGVSAESGVPTFREAQDGLWAQYRAEELATPDAFLADPVLIWRWYRWRRDLVTEAKPNPGHYAIAQLADLVPRLTLVTQNVDNLHQRAGSRDVIEFHGNIFEDRCFGDGSLQVGDDATAVPVCSECGSNLRPGVVWFGEAIPEQALNESCAAASDCNVFLSVGTSSLVYPAAGLADLAKQNGAMVVEVNPNTTMNAANFDYSLAANSGVALPELVNCLAV